MDEFYRCFEIISDLRKYCPSDRQKKVEDVLKYLREELSEVNSAVKNCDMENLKEEIGDVFFNMFF